MRFAVLKVLKETPKNHRQLALLLNVDYKTIQHHLRILHDNHLVEVEGKGYGGVYFLSEETDKDWKFISDLFKGVSI
ncbi:winged helix-turn-helix transcriptional regulator [Candidatus Micrarchaeota archaeon]|nr:winged helix-turn-helix transcriptional regulator [Candidatus Micrarchaeota archaeon]